MIKIIDVNCPYTKRSQQISVDYCYVPVMGTLQKNYKKMSYECPMYDECPPDLINMVDVPRITVFLLLSTISVPGIAHRYFYA